MNDIFQAIEAALISGDYLKAKSIITNLEETTQEGLGHILSKDVITENDDLFQGWVPVVINIGGFTIDTGFGLSDTDFIRQGISIIEKVKGKRNPALWDPRCEQYQRKLAEGTVKKSTTS